MSERKGKVEFFADKRGEYRWRLKATNGEVIADSAEGYKSKQGCKNGYESVQRNCQDAEVVEQW